MEQNAVSWGIQQLFIRPGDGYEYQMEAGQEATVNAKATIAELMGDDSLVPLDTQPKAKDLSVKVKNGMFSMKMVSLLVGGTYVEHAAGFISTTATAESEDQSMKNAVSAIGAGGSGDLTTDTYTLMARSVSTYVVIPSSTGIPSGPYTVGYPNTTAIPGVTFTVAGSLVTGSIASIKTVKIGETLQVATQAKNDFAAKVGVRVITENIEGQGQFEFLFPLCQSTGLVHPAKHKDYALIDGEFKVLYSRVLGKSLEWRRYSRA